MRTTPQGMCSHEFERMHPKSDFMVCHRCGDVISQPRKRSRVLQWVNKLSVWIEQRSRQ